MIAGDGQRQVTFGRSFLCHLQMPTMLLHSSFFFARQQAVCWRERLAEAETLAMFIDRHYRLLVGGFPASQAVYMKRRVAETIGTNSLPQHFTWHLYMLSAVLWSLLAAGRDAQSITIRTFLMYIFKELCRTVCHHTGTLRVFSNRIVFQEHACDVYPQYPMNLILPKDSTQYHK